MKKIYFFFFLLSQVFRIFPIYNSEELDLPSTSSSDSCASACVTMAPCPKTSGNVSTTFSDIESDEDPRKNELGTSKDWLSEVYSGDYSIPFPYDEMNEFYLPNSESMSMDNQFNENENNLKTDVVLKLNNDSQQEITFETNEEKPSYLLDHCYSFYLKNLTNDNVPHCNAAINVSSESDSTTIGYETSSNGSLGEEIDDDVEENTVLPVNIEMQNYRGRGRRRVRNNIKQIIEKVQNETHSKRNKKKGKVEKDEATRFRHNKMERERRDDIRNGFLNLASVMNISTKYSNVSLLDKAFTMITDLEEEDRELVIIEKELTRQNEILEQNLQSYKNILNGH